MMTNIQIDYQELFTGFSAYMVWVHSLSFLPCNRSTDQHLFLIKSLLLQALDCIIIACKIKSLCFILKVKLVFTTPRVNVWQHWNVSIHVVWYYSNKFYIVQLISIYCTNVYQWFWEIKQVFFTFDRITTGIQCVRNFNIV